MKLKYVIGTVNGLDHVVFGDTEHAELARALGKAESAGFCQFSTNREGDVEEVWTFGESTSLKLKSRPEDKEIIKRAMNRKG